MTMHILLVDDLVLDIALTLNALDGCVPSRMIKSAADGAEARALLTGHQFDLVILDLKMPRVDGFELMRWMNSNITYQLPVFVLSSSAFDRDRYLAHKLGAVEYVQKAIDFSEFKQDLQAALKRQGFC